jgi:hypothetical protein
MAGWSDWIAGWLEIPLLRYAAALFISVAFLSMVSQQLSIMNSVTNLEARLARGPRPQVRFAYTVNLESVKHLKEAKELDRLLPLGLPTNADKRILVSPETLIALQDFIMSRTAANRDSSRAIAMIDSLVRHLQKEGAVSLQLASEGESK